MYRLTAQTVKYGNFHHPTQIDTARKIILDAYASKFLWLWALEKLDGILAHGQPGHTQMFESFGIDCAYLEHMNM